jgi:membrane fusion protein (multidrug efflux system)
MLLGRAMGQAQGILGSLTLPPGYEWSFGRWNRMAQQDQAGASFALLFAMLLVYLLMSALFESLSHPFAIMASVPFAFIGVGVVMKLFSQPRDNFTELGFLILVGVVVNNAIVLVDHINRLRQEGHGRDEAILEGGRHRLRAILMTAVTTILGLLPMVAPVIFPHWLGPLEGRAATWAPVGLVILGGLTTSTFLTLVFIPTVYSLVDDAGVFLRRVVRAAAKPGTRGGGRPALESAKGALPLVPLLLLLPLLACGGGEPAAPGGSGGSPGERGGDRAARTGGAGERRGGPSGSGPHGGSSRAGGPGGWGGSGGGETAGPAVPVRVARVTRRPIAQYFQTQGTLEAENEVDLVARTTGPVVELATEEGRRVAKGDLLARLDDREIRAQLEVAQVRLKEARTIYERAKELDKAGLVSQEGFDRARAEYQSAQGDFERLRVQLAYTEITAPFSGLVVERYVRFAEHVGAGDRLFRISDFDPLLCPIQVPERELPRLAVGQTAVITVEAFPGRRFDARVLRLSPVVDAATGTVKVTLEVEGGGVLRPGMFATVQLEMERRPDALVIPKSALALDSLGDAVFVAENGVAQRRSLVLGFQNQDLLEVREGLSEGEPVIAVGQDGLSDGTPVEVMGQVEVDGAAGPDVPEASPAPQAAARAPSP